MSSSPTTSQHQNETSINENTNVDPEILRLREQIENQNKTLQQWKKSVKEQLTDAQTKNRALKKERDEARDKLLESDAVIRAEISKEYKERFAMKEEQVRGLQEELSNARNDRQQAANDHINYVEKLLSEHESKIGMIETAISQKMMSSIAAKEHEIERLQNVNSEQEHKIYVLMPKVTLLEKQLQDSEAQVKALHMQLMSFKEHGTQSAEIFEKKHMEETQKYDGIIMELKEENGKLRREVESVSKRAQESHLQFQSSLEDNIRAEVQLREDQVQVLQVMLKQTQQDATTFQHKCAALQAQLDSEIDSREAKISTIRTNLVNKMSELELVKQLKDKFEKENIVLRETVKTLEEEQEARELIFNEMILSGDDKQYINVLEAQISQAQQNQTATDREVRLLKDLIEEERSKTQHAIDNLGAEKEAIIIQHQELDIKMGKLRAQEYKVREQLSLLVKQADMNLSMSASYREGGSKDRGQKGPRGGIGNAQDEYECRSVTTSDNQSNDCDHASLKINDEWCIVNRTGERISTAGRRNKQGISSMDGNRSIIGSRVSGWLSEGVTAARLNATPATVTALYNNIRTLQSHRRRLLIFFIVFLFISSIVYYQTVSSAFKTEVILSGRKGTMSGMTATELIESLSLCKIEFNNLAGKWNSIVGQGIMGATGGKMKAVAMMPMLESVERASK